MGSDFTYDDLGDRHPSEDSHKILREESLKGEECYVVESIPLDENSAYSRMVSWIIKDKWIGLKREYYDEDEELLKVLTVKSFDKIDGYWVLLNFEMHNVQKDHTTRMELVNVTIDHGIADSTFTERMMKSGIK
jgi:outer membrane lipoprotein-sorting protein